MYLLIYLVDYLLIYKYFLTKIYFIIFSFCFIIAIIKVAMLVIVLFCFVEKNNHSKSVTIV